MRWKTFIRGGSDDSKNDLKPEVVEKLSDRTED